MKLRIYLDTSIFSAYYDDRAPDRRAQTEEFWARIAAFEASTSELAREELQKTPDRDRRMKLLKLLDSLDVHSVTEEIKKLAQNYVKAGVFAPVMLNDAVHIAAAVITRQDIYCYPGISSIWLIGQDGLRSTRSIFLRACRALRL